MAADFRKLVAVSATTTTGTLLASECGMVQFSKVQFYIPAGLTVDITVSLNDGTNWVAPSDGSALAGEQIYPYSSASVSAVKVTRTAGSGSVVIIANSAVSGGGGSAAAGGATSANQTNGSQKTQIVDGSGNVIGATANALDVNIKSGVTLEVNLDNANDDVLVYGWDGAANQKIKTDASGELQVDVLSSALPTGASTAAKQPALGTAGTASSDVITVQGIASMTPLLVNGSAVTQPVSIATNTPSGSVAHDGAASAVNPLLVGGYASAAAPTNVSTDTDAVRAWYLLNGAQATVLTAAGALIGGDASNGLDVDVTRMAALIAGSATIGNTIPAAGAAGTGATTYRSLDLDESEEEVKATAGTLYGFQFYNAAATVLYLKWYNATAANVTVGTTTPVRTYPIPATTAGTMVFPVGVDFGTAITMAVTTGLADNDTGAPAANAFIIDVDFK